jgi:hypothetical protein
MRHLRRLRLLAVALAVAFISGRPKETCLALLKELNARIVAGAGISPDDLMMNFSSSSPAVDRRNSTRP